MASVFDLKKLTDQLVGCWQPWDDPGFRSGPEETRKELEPTGQVATVL